MTLKRSISTGAIMPPPSLKRTTPECVGYTPFAARNIEDGETVHQACLLVSGQCHSCSESSETDFVTAKCKDGFTKASGAQHWPIVKGTWKALVLLSPGSNYLDFELHHEGAISGDHKLIVNYIPLLQLPPLHLAIMVAKDSPLLIDCPPSKYGAISSAHSSLDAAIAKFRMTACMWQALTAEDMRSKGLGRRTFRLDEEWNANTASREASRQFPNAATDTGAVPRVHIVRADKTVAELRDDNHAQQKSDARSPGSLHKFFEDALRSYGGPFASNNRPVVAGLILDSSYSIESDLIHAHVALGCHKPDGLSLGMFGSHLTYSWPRFLEEVPACLLDDTLTGDTVGNDNGECNTLREACFVGQGAFLHEVGHAFGADHSSGIMARGYSKHWSRNFLGPIDSENNARWDLQDALRFKMLPHFRVPGDKPLAKDAAQASININTVLTTDFDGICTTSIAGLARIETVNGGESTSVDLMDWDNPTTTYTFPNMDEHHDRSETLSLTVLAMNGKERTIKDLWKFLKQNTFIRVAGEDFMLRKQSIKSETIDENTTDSEFCEWALLLKEKGANGQLHRATAIDLRVGCTFDGAVVYYADGHTTNCGEPSQRNFGGHASEKEDLPKGASISMVEIRRSERRRSLEGIRMTLDNGTRWGELHDFDSDDDHKRDCETLMLGPMDDEKIVGFFGRSSGYCYEFGIITAPKDRELPDVVYEMRELQNRVDYGLVLERSPESEDGTSEERDDDNSSENRSSEGCDSMSDHA